MEIYEPIELPRLHSALEPEERLHLDVGAVDDARLRATLVGPDRDFGGDGRGSFWRSAHT